MIIDTTSKTATIVGNAGEIATGIGVGTSGVLNTRLAATTVIGLRNIALVIAIGGSIAAIRILNTIPIATTVMRKAGIATLREGERTVRVFDTLILSVAAVVDFTGIVAVGSSIGALRVHNARGAAAAVVGNRRSGRLNAPLITENAVSRRISGFKFVIVSRA